MNELSKLGICLTVYNQIDLVEWNLKNILKYDRDDIEVIVSDDCSTDDIRGLCEKLDDKRIKYYRTPNNGGHDRNILFALSKCSSDYAIVLRSRDSVIPERITEIIELIEKNNSLSYGVFSSVDESGRTNVSLSDRIYKRGFEAIEAHKRVFIHPSGNIYRLSLLNLELYRKYIDNYFDNIYSFVVHDLIRMKLATKGDFVTSSNKAWIYSETSKSKDVAVNSGANKKSVYDPEYLYPRYRCEFEFVQKHIPKKYQYSLTGYLIKRFYKNIAYDFRLFNKNEDLKKHYNYEGRSFLPREERKKFRNYTDGLICNSDNRTKYKIIIALETFKHIFVYPLITKCRDILVDKPFFVGLYRKYKRV